MAKTKPLASIGLADCTKEQFTSLCERAIIESSEHSETVVAIRNVGTDKATVDLARKVNVHTADIELFTNEDANWWPTSVYDDPVGAAIDSAHSGLLVVRQEY